jgi:Fe-S-cluster containining protein
VQYDCLTCGACCYGPEEYVAVSGTDLHGISVRTQSRFVVKRRDRMFLKMLHGHCAALHARQGHFSCRMYAERPTPCRVVEPGGRECLDARRRHSITA